MRAFIHDLTDAFKRGETTPSKVTDAYLARMAMLDERVGAYITVTADHARSAARAADERYRQRRPLGPIDGAPIALKDVFCTKGVRTTCASKILENFVPPFDATVVDRLAGAGAVMLGKSNMDEFAMGSSTEHSALQGARHPGGLRRGPRGPSGRPAAPRPAGAWRRAPGAPHPGAPRPPPPRRPPSRPAQPPGPGPYSVLGPAEASSNLARYDGVKYGLRVPGHDLIDMESKTRAAGFGAEVKRRIMLGTYVLSAGYYDAYYGQAQKV